MAGNHWLQITYVANTTKMKEKKEKQRFKFIWKTKTIFGHTVCLSSMSSLPTQSFTGSRLSIIELLNHCIVDLNVICVCIYCKCGFTWFWGTKNSSHQTPFDCGLQCCDCLHLLVCWLPVFPAFWYCRKWVNFKTIDQCKLMSLQNYIAECVFLKECVNRTYKTGDLWPQNNLWDHCPKCVTH